MEIRLLSLIFTACSSGNNTDTAQQNLFTNVEEPITLTISTDQLFTTGTPWRMDTEAFPQVIGSFTLMDPGKGTDFSRVKNALLPSVRVIEDGEVRTVIEAVMSYNDSFICQTYKLPKQGTEMEVQLRVYWNEKDKMLKLSVPTALGLATFIERGFSVFFLENE